MLCNGDSRVIYFWFRTVELSGLLDLELEWMILLDSRFCN